MDLWSSFLLMTLPAGHKSFNLSVSWDHFLSNHNSCLVCLGCKIIPNIFVLMTYTNFRKAPPTTTISSYFWGEMEIFFSGFCKEIEEAMFVCVSVYAFVCGPESVTVWMERQWHTLAERTGWHEYESWKTQTKKKKVKCIETIRVWSPGSKVIDVNLSQSTRGAINVSSYESKAECRMTFHLKDHLAERKTLSYLAFYSIEIISGLEEAPSHRGGRCALLGLLNQMLISLRNLKKRCLFSHLCTHGPVTLMYELIIGSYCVLVRTYESHLPSCISPYVSPFHLYML